MDVVVYLNIKMKLVNIHARFSGIQGDFKTHMHKHVFL